jgi:hypothetical protein
LQFPPHCLLAVQVHEALLRVHLLPNSQSWNWSFSGLASWTTGSSDQTDATFWGLQRLSGAPQPLPTWPRTVPECPQPRLGVFFWEMSV